MNEYKKQPTFAYILLGIGIVFLFKKVLPISLSWLDWDLIWPILLIMLAIHLISKKRKYLIRN